MGSYFVVFGRGLGLSQQPVGKCTKVIMHHCALRQVHWQRLAFELFTFTGVHQMRTAACSSDRLQVAQRIAHGVHALEVHARAEGAAGAGQHAEQQGDSVICRTCGEQCERDAIRFRLAAGGVATPVIDPTRCNGCGRCVAACPVKAVAIATVTTPSA
mgnify:CR=1 FL=1